jgi:uncharacterized membrane protein YfcA
MLFLVAGLVTGVFGGVFGIGGGAILVPMLIYIFRMTQHQAQGTSLAVLLPPVGIFAFLQYYRAGFVDLRAAGWLAAGFMAGAAVGALFAERIQPGVLRRGFGVILLLVALQMILGPSDNVGL